MLQKLGTKLLNQAASNDALEDLGKSKDVESLRNAVNNIFDEVGYSEYNVQHINSILDRGKGLLSLIKSNISAASKSKNFDVVLMESDKSEVQDIIFRIESIKTVHTNQLYTMNELHNKHIKIQKLIED